MIVRDEQERGADLALDGADHAEHVLLHDHVERGRGLVGDDEFRPADGGERDGDALAHAAGELVRIGVQHARRRADQGEMRHDARLEGGAGAAQMCAPAKSSKERRIRRSGLSTLIEPCMM